MLRRTWAKIAKGTLDTHLQCNSVLVDLAVILVVGLCIIKHFIHVVLKLFYGSVFLAFLFSLEK